MSSMKTHHNIFFINREQGIPSGQGPWRTLSVLSGISNMSSITVWFQWVIYEWIEGKLFKIIYWPFKTSQAIVTTPVGADGKSRDLAILLANRFPIFLFQYTISRAGNRFPVSRIWYPVLSYDKTSCW